MPSDFEILLTGDKNIWTRHAVEDDISNRHTSHISQSHLGIIIIAARHHINCSPNLVILESSEHRLLISARQVEGGWGKEWKF